VVKVCVVGLRGIPDVPGGIETHCENLFTRMAEQSPETEIVIFGRVPYIGRTTYHTQSGLQVVPAFAARSKYLETISNTFVALCVARFSQRPDYVHLHAIGPGLLAPMARLLGLRVVLTHHGDDFRRAKWNRFARAALRLGERLGVGSAERVIAVSPSLATRLKADYPRRADRIRYVPNGADHIVARSRAANGAEVLARFGLADKGYIVSVGRLVPEKGFADLIRAHKASGIDTPLVIVGGQSHSPHDQELEDLAHEGVILTGSLPMAEVAQLLAHARLFVLASHHEGLPIAALEAGAMGAPLLLSDITPNLDVGLAPEHYFRVGNAQELATRLAGDALDLPPSDLLTEFNWSSIAQRTAEIYQGRDD